MSERIVIDPKVSHGKVLVEFYNDGRVFALFSARQSQMRVVPVAVDPASSRLR